MPVLIDIESRDHHLFGECEENRMTMSFASPKGPLDCLSLGVINNMPDSALISTERQLFDVLNAAAGGIPVRLQFYSLPLVPRADWGKQYTRRFYADVNDLWSAKLDGVIVTGAEPQTPKLTAEPYWSSLAQVIDWAQENTLSAVWSCLAVHGAVLHLDGIERHLLDEKCSGVFDQVKKQAHPLVEGLGWPIKIPHSRWNEVHEGSLASAGYNVLTRSLDAGVDMFVKRRRRSLFVFFQGHPEYDAHSLLGEYRRDVGRYLRGEIERYPRTPYGYFDDEAMDLLMRFRKVAMLDRQGERFANFPVDQVAMNLKTTWRIAARRIYHNWITYLSERKASEVKGARSPTARDAAVSSH
jgi:homoserine O-succinyltransferase/O-acetyltransferase